MSVMVSLLIANKYGSSNTVLALEIQICGIPLSYLCRLLKTNPTFSHQQSQAAERKTKHCRVKVAVFPCQCQNINKWQNPVQNKLKWLHMYMYI